MMLYLYCRSGNFHVRKFPCKIFLFKTIFVFQRYPCNTFHWTHFHFCMHGGLFSDRVQKIFCLGTDTSEKSDWKCFPKLAVRPEAVLKMSVRSETLTRSGFLKRVSWDEFNWLSVERWYTRSTRPPKFHGWIGSNWIDSSRYLIEQLYWRERSIQRTL